MKRTLLIAMICSGCATTMYNQRPGADFKQDYAHCKMKAEVAATQTTQPGQMFWIMKKNIDYCMYEKGWRK